MCCGSGIRRARKTPEEKAAAKELRLQSAQRAATERRAGMARRAARAAAVKAAKAAAESGN